MNPKHIQDALNAFSAATRFITEHQGDVTPEDLDHMYATVETAAHTVLDALSAPPQAQADDKPPNFPDKP